VVVDRVERDFYTVVTERTAAPRERRRYDRHRGRG
jgi:hypothetical protein